MQMKSSWRTRLRGWWWYETKVQVGVREEMVGFIYPRARRRLTVVFPPDRQPKNKRESPVLPFVEGKTSFTCCCTCIRP